MRSHITCEIFYTGVLRWLETGEGECRKDFGLCENLSVYIGPNEDRAHLQGELEASFYLCGLSYNSPFNTGFSDFLQESYDRNLYKNPRRLAWLRNGRNGIVTKEGT